MRRVQISPRSQWQRIVESQGLHFHTLDDLPYWDESVFYQFDSRQVDTLEKATYALNEMCLKAVDHVFANQLLSKFQIPEAYHEWLSQSWERDEFTVYGRFDLAYDGVSPPKMLEYNADTPTALLEASVIQWFWLKDVHPRADQFNSIHERLIEAWKSYGPVGVERLYFAGLPDSLEDFITVTYLRDTALQAGHQTEFIPINAIGWNQSWGEFVDEQERAMRRVFKLYPWEWLLREAFSPHLLTTSAQWLEPPWKMILSNKAILPVLYELYPESPYLLEASFEPLGGSQIRKPMYSREGANVALLEGEQVVMETEGEYEGPYVYQRNHPLPAFGGNYPVIGSWMVNGYACGIGIREDTTPITQNTSRFVPHVLIS